MHGRAWKMRGGVCGKRCASVCVGVSLKPEKWKLASEANRVQALARVNDE